MKCMDFVPATSRNLPVAHALLLGGHVLDSVSHCLLLPLPHLSYFAKEQSLVPRAVSTICLMTHLPP